MIEDFKSQLLELGLSHGDVVLMHSSMKALKTKKSPTEFINDIISVLGPEGTLLIPGFTWKHVNSRNPNFKVKETEPCDGLIPRTFLHMPGVIRSLHPTHSVCAFGKRAKELTSNHILDETPVGFHSPIMRMLDYNGKILFVGDVLHACTFMHGVEEIVGAPYTLAKKRRHYVIEDEDGKVIEKDMIRHDFNGWMQEYQRIKDILDYPDIKTGKVGQAECYLIEASALFTKAKEKFNENVFYFVTDIRE
ncbi:MAG: AAC(3) family N-acetyltransferase [Treponema sp.]|jgi:aminoglycoside 3-N-acetyltransferase|nr:AAC(3) family N-acetyltransferase [Treponema sp.]